MSNWYYADRDRQRHGPMSAPELTQAFRDGHVGLDALVWRDGLAHWRPLSELAGELGLLADTAPQASQRPLPDAWSSAPAAEASPYAAPASTLSMQAAPVAGGEIVYAGFLKRLAASTLDGLIIGAAMLVVLFVVVLIMGVGGSLFSDLERGRSPLGGAMGVTFVLLFYLVPFAVQGAYYTLMHASGSQATLGKMAVGIKVVRANGERLSILRSLGRFAALFLLGAVTCNITLIASAVMAGVTERKQGVHDMMCDTLVVDRWAFTAHPERQRRELGGVTIAMLVLAALAVLGYAAIIVFAGIAGAMSNH